MEECDANGVPFSKSGKKAQPMSYSTTAKTVPSASQETAPESEGESEVLKTDRPKKKKKKKKDKKKKKKKDEKKSKTSKT